MPEEKISTGLATDARPLKLYAKLLEFQKEMEPIMKSKENPFYKSKYSDINDLLEIVKPKLNALGILLLQPLSNIWNTTESVAGIKTILFDTESHQSIEETFPLMESKDVQKQGGAITYTRRYAIQSMLALQAEDDDGNSNVNKPKSASDQVEDILS